MKSEAYRLSGATVPRTSFLLSVVASLLSAISIGGTLRWQAPEVVAGQGNLTQAVDIYAFAISCVEILTKGSVPWHLQDDDAVRQFVLSESLAHLLSIVC